NPRFFFTASISDGAGDRKKEMLRKKYHVVRKKYHVVRKIFYVASIFCGTASCKNGPPWTLSSTPWTLSSTAGTLSPTHPVETQCLQFVYRTPIILKVLLTVVKGRVQRVAGAVRSPFEAFTT
ncbi:MAG: hypothetical protein MR516_04410, partial [Bacteroidales bacterium]|nr:hypothetical protein [Bacteroidales bacterium]